MASLAHTSDDSPPPVQMIPRRDIIVREPFVGMFPVVPAVVDALVADMKECGFHPGHPLTIWRCDPGGQPVLIDGHMRLLAASGVGIREVPAVSMIFSSQQQALEWVFAEQVERRRNLTKEQAQAFLVKAIAALDQLKPRGGARKSAAGSRVPRPPLNPNARPSAPRSCSTRVPTRSSACALWRSMATRPRRRRCVRARSHPRPPPPASAPRAPPRNRSARPRRFSRRAPQRPRRRRRRPRSRADLPSLPDLHARVDTIYAMLSPISQYAFLGALEEFLEGEEANARDEAKEAGKRNIGQNLGRGH